MESSWPVELLEEPEGITMTFPDVPGAVTWGKTRLDALAQAPDALASIFSALVADGKPIPLASASAGRPVARVRPLDAAKIALHTAMLEKSVSNVELGRLMGLHEKAVRRAAPLGPKARNVRAGGCLNGASRS